MTIHDTSQDLQAFEADWLDWQREHHARLADRHGFLAITSLHWLSPQPQRFEDAPGAWSADAAGVHVVLDDGDELLVDDVLVRGSYDFGVIAERGGINALWNDAVIEVAKRGGYDIVRPRHPDAPLRAAFQGTPAYAPDPRWAVPGRYEAFDQPRPTTVGAAVEGLEHVYDAIGRISFEIDEQPLMLTAFAAYEPGSLSVLFTDATSGVTTYAANRYVTVGAPDAEGNLVLDFNRSANLPCAYTDLATCPLPPAENRLPVAIEAGQQTPFERGGRQVERSKATRGAT